MRIAHCIHGLGLGGAQKVIATLVRNGPRIEPTVNSHFVYSSSGGVLLDEMQSAGAEVSILERQRRRIDPSWTRALRRVMERDQVDLVHCHLFGDTLHGYLAALPLGIPVIATMHTEYRRLPLFQRWGYRFVLPRLAAAVACGEGAHRSLSRSMPGLESLVISNGIDPIVIDSSASQAAVANLRSDLGIPDDALLVATIGRLTQEKAPAFLLDSFSQTRQPNTHLVFLGDGPLRPSLEAIELDARTRERIHFAGFRDGIPELLPGLDIVVFASDHEGLSIALLEAMATSRPLIVTNVAGNLDAVTDQAEALVVEKRNVSALAEAIDRLARDPEQRLQLGAGARRRFEEVYSADRMVASYHRLYDRLLSAGQSKAGSDNEYP